MEWENLTMDQSNRVAGRVLNIFLFWKATTQMTRTSADRDAVAKLFVLSPKDMH
jgi:hypothetical protein